MRWSAQPMLQEIHLRIRRSFPPCTFCTLRLGNQTAANGDKIGIAAGEDIFGYLRSANIAGDDRGFMEFIAHRAGEIALPAILQRHLIDLQIQVVVLRRRDVDDIDLLWQSSRIRRESSRVLPPLRKSSALMRRLTGKRGPTQARTLSTIRLSIRVRFSTLPPNSSVRLLNSGDKNWLIK